MDKHDLLVDAETNDHEDEVPAGRDLPSTGSRFWLILALFLVGINLRPAISSLAPVLAAVRGSTGMSSAGAGMLTTLPVLCFGLFAPLAPRLARRFSSEQIVMAGLLILAAGTGLRIFGIGGLFLGTLVAGASISVVMVLLPGIIKREFPDRPGLMMGMYTMALCLGAALSAGATVPIQNLAGGDWRPALGFWVLPVIIAALFWWPRLRHVSQHGRTGHFAVRGLLSDRIARQLTLFMGTQSSLAYVVFGWLPTILIDRGMQALAAGFVLSVSITAQLVTALGGPWIATRGKDQRAAIVVLMCMSLIGFLGCLYAPLDALWPWAILLGLGQGGTFSVALTMIVLRAPNAHVAASLSGMTQGIGYTMAALGPLVVGLLHDLTHAWHAVAIFFTAVGVVAMVAGVGAGRNVLVEARVEKVD